MDIENIKVHSVLIAKIKNVDEELVCYVKEIYKHSEDLLIKPLERCNSLFYFDMSQQYIAFDEVIDIIGNLDTFEQENPEYYI